MYAWYRVVVVILRCIVLDAYSSNNNCEYYNTNIDCFDNLDIIPILSNTLTTYKMVCKCICEIVLTH